jgi:hypothetical protein
LVIIYPFESIAASGMIKFLLKELMDKGSFSLRFQLRLTRMKEPVRAVHKGI